MARPTDDALRSELIERGIAYACRHGISALSLRPLAKALGTTAPLLIYHFGSKDALLVEIIKAARLRQRAALAESTERGLSDADAAKQLWRSISTPESLPLAKLFFEVYALALQDPSRFPGFIEGAVHGWIDAIVPAKPTELERLEATALLAAFRGFLLDLCATGDRKRVDRSVDLLLDRFNGAA
jgi:AcrR family transcriptional regulator